MLNTPSSNSQFAKPVKKCFKAPKKRVVAAIDFAALEDRVMGNLSGDLNKLRVFLDDVDNHSLSVCYYWPQASAKIVGDLTDPTAAAKRFKEAVDAKVLEAIELRSRGKRITFGLAYGCFPPKVASAAKIPLSEAEELFDNYHNKMYPGVTDYRENYVLPFVRANGYIHTGLGFRLYSDSPDRDIRSLNNATCQFWSILTAFTMNKLHQLIDAEGLDSEIKITSSIYDSIYFNLEDDPKIIKWLNDRIVPIMEKDFMEGQIVQNSVDLEIGPDWSELYKLPHNATIEEIKEIRKSWT